MKTDYSEIRTLFNLLRQSIANYFPVLKVIWVEAIIIALLKNLIFIVDLAPWHYLIKDFLFFIVSLGVLFIIGMLLYHANCTLSGSPSSLKSSFETIRIRFLRLVLAAFIIGLIVVITFLLAHWFLVYFNLFGKHLNTLVFFILGFILISDIMYCFFIIPLITIDNYSLGKAIVESGNFMQNGIKIIILNFFFVIILWILIDPYSLHQLWLQKKFLSLPFDIIVFVLFLPFLTNLIILSKNNLQIKELK